MSDEVESSLDVEVTYDRGATTVLVGELDMTGTAPFWAHVSEALETQPPSITVEAGGLTFIDSYGLVGVAPCPRGSGRGAGWPALLAAD
jgi:hypothetical protein